MFLKGPTYRKNLDKGSGPTKLEPQGCDTLPDAPDRCIVRYAEPDLWKCLQLPLFCDDLSTVGELPVRGIDLSKRLTWAIPAEYCMRSGLETDPTDFTCDDGSKHITTLASAYEYFKTVDDYRLSELEPPWLKGFDQFDYECNPGEDDGAEDPKVVIGRQLEDSFFEYILDKQGETIDETWAPANGAAFRGCCQCEPKAMPEFFTQHTIANPGFPDNKHTRVQLALTALQNLEVTACVELIDGRHYRNFDDAMTDAGEIFVHSPHRAAMDGYIASRDLIAPFHDGRKDLDRERGGDGPWRRRASFVTLLELDVLDETIELPLNMPFSWRRIAGNPQSDSPVGNPGYELYEERELFIDRPWGVDDSDPCFGASLHGEPRKVALEQVCSYDQRIAYYRSSADDVNSTVAVTDDATEDIDEDDGRDLSTLYAVRDKYESARVPWEFDDDFIALPYFPFFSNCDGYDSHMSVTRLLETHPDCTFQPYENTLFIDEFEWISAAEADQCGIEIDDGDEPYVQGIELQCTYEESILTSTDNPRWFEQEPGTLLFKMSTDPLPLKYFEAQEDGRWGRSKKVDLDRKTDAFLEVTVSDESESMGGVLPRHVVLTIDFYQRKRGYKSLVSVGVTYLDTCVYVQEQVNKALYDSLIDATNGGPECVRTWNDARLKTVDYRLEVVFVALDWFDLLNFFQFTWITYMMFFTLVGAVTVAQAALIWAINRLLTKLRHPPKFHSEMLLRAVSGPPIVGSVLATVPVMLGCAFAGVWFRPPVYNIVSLPSWITFADIPGDWLVGPGGLDEQYMLDTAYGRMGVCFVAIGIYVHLVCATLLIPDWSEEKDPDAAPEITFGEEDEEDAVPDSDIWNPTMWKRAHFVWCSCCVCVMLLSVFEFSYSDAFEENIYMVLAASKVVFQLVDVVLDDLLREALLLNPLSVVIELTMILVTMGASDFVEFVSSYFFELSVMILERLYLDPFIANCMKLWPRWRMMLIRRFGRRRRMTREDKAKEEMEWRRINEEIELQSEGVEPLMDSYSSYSCQVTAMFLSPVVNIFLIVFAFETQIPKNYGIKDADLVYYTLFAFNIAAWTLLLDVFVLNTQELVYGWKVYDYVSYQRYRFSVRDKRWMMDAKVVDESIEQSMQTLDLLCFSSQYYFLNSLLPLGSIVMMFGITVFFRYNYIIFGDQALMLIVLVMFVVGDLIQWLLRFLSDIKIRRIQWRGLWVTKQIEGTVDDDVAAKLAIGEGRQADLEQERLELQALNSERFRHRFLERNRPWILQHLVELLTPESLEQIGPDGRPVVEYVRDVYAELMAMGEGARRPGDRSDISSDEGEDDQGPAKDWPREPLQGASLAIARLWLAKARKRRAFSKLITGIIEANKANKCAICQRTTQMGATMMVSLATDGQADPYAIDRLIAGFEEAYSPKEKDANLWKAYFRANAEFITRCDRCLNELEKAKLKRDVRAPGAGARTRPDDISDEESDEDVAFDPMIVVRESGEGRMMSKWLNAARRRLGGEFPRPDARAQMERYAEKMRRRKLRGGKTKIAGEETLGEQMDEQAAKWTVRINAASRAIALRWMRKAQDEISAKFRAKGETLRSDVERTVRAMPPEEDWYFGAALREEGSALQDKGEVLFQDQRTIEAETTVKIRRIEADFEAFEQEQKADIDSARAEFEGKMAQAADAANLEVEMRTRELQRNKDERRKELEAEEAKAKEEDGAASTEMMEKHRRVLEDMDGQIRQMQTRAEKARLEAETAERTYFDQSEKLKKQAIIDRRITAIQNIRRIRKTAMEKVRSDEADWQGRAARWLYQARRKVELKAREDAEAAAAKRRKKRR